MNEPGEFTTPLPITEIDLTRDAIPEPKTGHRIQENRFGIASYTPDQPVLMTMGISACKGLVFYDPVSKKGLMAHISVLGNAPLAVAEMAQEFGDLKEADAYVINGQYQSTGATKLRGKTLRWPTLEDLVSAVSKQRPKSVSLDRSSGRIKGLSLNLDSGKLSEIDGSSGWTWSSIHDLSVNQRIEDFINTK